MEEQKFRLTLTGNIIDGFEREEVEEALSRLLKLPVDQVHGMLEGKRSRIRAELDLERAEHLQQKVIARGAECTLSPVKPVAAEHEVLAEQFVAGQREATVKNGDDKDNEFELEFEIGSDSQEDEETDEQLDAVVPANGDEAGDLELEIVTDNGEEGKTEASIDTQVDAVAPASGDEAGNLELELEPVVDGGESPVETHGDDASAEKTTDVAAGDGGGLELDMEPLEDEGESPAVVQEVDAGAEQSTDIAAGEEANDPGLELELVTDGGDSAADAQDDSTRPMEAVKADAPDAAPAPTEEPAGDAEIVLSTEPVEPIEPVKQEAAGDHAGESDEGKAQFFEEPHVIANKIEKEPKKALPVAILAGVLVLGVVGVAGWYGSQFLMQPDKPAEKQKPVSVNHVEPEPSNPELALSEKRLGLLTRSVKVWMIQYGFGFNPQQVTLSRLGQDLGMPESDFQDGWGNAIRYEAGEKSFTLRSAGPDGAFGTADDLQSVGKL
ncbi:hypothetical protein [Solemya velesiana gill symbiont]|uniref:Type II secretion system protein GspG C-terminal domain-containing protein n=1 Tax=Solemya velesiana gill symbiont TaxID=1918948 RepID=A0A1T2KSV9_9GAMM|nr:hypothetical protein [Solemya velesiana gill symbiont]OOZ35945.1 hypothetical protein BOW51_09555 [Solemya velesiana gill symbiont]